MNYLVITIFVVIGIGALLIAQKIAQREHQKRLIQSKCKRILQRANDIFDIATLACSYIKYDDVIDALLKHYKHYIHQREQLHPQTDTSALLTQADTLKTQYNPNDIIIELKSDNEINRCKQAFNKTIQILGACASKRFIDTESYKRMKHNLKFTLIQLEVDAYEELADIAGEKKDPAMATNYYKYAKKILIESDINFDGKHEHIREITRKNQLLFGNIVKEKIEQQIESENAVDEYGFPTDLNVMSGKAKKD
ncbi:hypothetical protein ACU6U9_16090 [Pseudomonas sp. HK3]